MRYRSSSKITTAKWCRSLIDEALGYSNVTYAPRSLLILLTIEKNKIFNLEFVFFLFFSIMHNSKTILCVQTICTSNDCYTIRDFPFFVRATCKLTSVSYGSKHALQSLFDFTLSLHMCTTWKLKLVHTCTTWKLKLVHTCTTWKLKLVRTCTIRKHCA